MKSGSPAGNMSSRRSNGSCPPAQERREVNKSSHHDELHMERCNKDPLTRKKRNNSQAYSIPIKRPTKTRSLTEKNEALTATRQPLSFHGTKRTLFPPSRTSCLPGDDNQQAESVTCREPPRLCHAIHGDGDGQSATAAFRGRLDELHARRL